MSTVPNFDFFVMCDLAGIDFTIWLDVVAFRLTPCPEDFWEHWFFHFLRVSCTGAKRESWRSLLSEPEVLEGSSVIVTVSHWSFPSNVEITVYPGSSNVYMNWHSIGLSGRATCVLVIRRLWRSPTYMTIFHMELWFYGMNYSTCSFEFCHCVYSLPIE